MTCQDVLLNLQVCGLSLCLDVYLYYIYASYHLYDQRNPCTSSWGSQEYPYFIWYIKVFSFLQVQLQVIYQVTTQQASSDNLMHVSCDILDCHQLVLNRGPPDQMLIVNWYDMNYQWTQMVSGSYHLQGDCTCRLHLKDTT